MIARIIKNKMRQLNRDKMKQIKSLSEEVFINVTVDFYSIVKRMNHFIVQKENQRINFVDSLIFFLYNEVIHSKVE